MKTRYVILMSAALATVSLQGHRVAAAAEVVSEESTTQITQSDAKHSETKPEDSGAQQSIEPITPTQATTGVETETAAATAAAPQASAVQSQAATGTSDKRVASASQRAGITPALTESKAPQMIVDTPSELTTATGKKLSLKELAPTLKNPKATISDPTIATVSNGILSFLKAGTLKLTLTDDAGSQRAIVITVADSKTDAFDDMRSAWQDIVVGDRYYQSGNNQMNSMRATQDEKVKTMWDTMHTDPGTQDLWDSGAALTSSANLTTDYRNLEAMAIAFVDPASQYYQNTDLLHDVLSGYDWMFANKYNSTVETYGNWWDWEIGVPRAINDIAVVLHPYLTQTQIDAGVTAIQRFVADPNMHRGSVNPKMEIEVTGANQVDISKVKIIQGILEKDGDAVKAAVKALEKVFPLVTTGEGFYADGTFLQHTDVGYNGSYGNVLLTGVAQLMAVIQNTPYAVSQSSLNNVQFWIEKGFAPFVYQGNLLDMVRGRAISRGDFQSNVAADELIRAIVSVSQTMPEAQRLNYQQMVKGWLSQGDNYQTYLSKATNYRDLALIRAIMEDSTIAATDPQATTLANFPHMDKVVYRNNEGKFLVGLSMSSKRTKRYEAMNHENIHGWYTGDGMVYVYNGDLDQFNDDFWATVDPTLLPGTTETTKPQADSSGTNDARDTFVGGATLDTVGAYAMRFSNNDGDLSGNKSWFMVGDHVVALGSAIENNSGAAANTVIEDRKLQDGKAYKVYVNGQLLDLNLGDSRTLENVTSIYLESETKGASMGYRFLTPQTVTLNLVQRTGAWRDINQAQSDVTVTKTYFQIIKPHTDKTADYDYVEYPNIGQTAFNQAKTTTILANDEDVQAIADEDGFTGINVYHPTLRNIAGVNVTKPISIVRQIQANEVKFAFTDPTQLSPQALAFSFKDMGYHVITKDDAVQLVLKDGIWTVTVTDAGMSDATFAFTLAKADSVTESTAGGNNGSDSSHQQEHNGQLSNSSQLTHWVQPAAVAQKSNVKKDTQRQGETLPQTGNHRSIGTTLAGLVLMLVGAIVGMAAKLKSHKA